MKKIVNRLRAAYVQLTETDAQTARVLDENNVFRASSRGWYKSNVL